MGLQIDKVVKGNIVFHSHTSDDLPSDTAYILVDTRANILATTPSAGKLALSTDEPAGYVYDGSKWIRHPIILGTPSTDTTIGAFPFNDDKGYHIFYLVHKQLVNCFIGGFSDTAAEGAIKYVPSTKKVMTYLNGAWRNVITLTADDEDALITYNDGWDLVDYYGHSLIHGHETTIGPFAYEHLLDGGAI